jgi:hypothetical protein
MHREALAVAVVALLACSSTTPAASTDAAPDITYYSGDGTTYTWNDAAPACQPESTASFTPVKIVPLVNPVCTDAQIVGLVTQCFDPSLPDDTACTAWKAIPENQGCLDNCPVASSIAPTPVMGNPPPTPVSPWGPLVKIMNPGKLEFWDLGTCVALADPSPAGQSCADALNAELECEYYACAGNCSIPLNPDAGALLPAEEAYQNCTLSADRGPCVTYVNAVTTCVSSLPANAPEMFCIDGSLLSGDPTSFDPAAEKIIGAQCGGALDDVSDASDSGG